MMNTTKQQRPRNRSWFRYGLIIMLLSVLLLTLFALARGALQWVEYRVATDPTLPPVWRDVVRVTLHGGQTVDLSPEALQIIQRDSIAWLEARRHRLRERMREQIRSGAQQAFSAAHAQVPAFADWHYSLTGEYARLFHALAGDLPGYIARRLQTLIFEPADTATAVTQLATRVDKQLSEQLRASVVDLQTQLATWVHTHRITPESTIPPRVSAQWTPMEAIASGFQSTLGLSSLDIGRQGAAGAAAAASAAVVFKKLGASSVAKSSAAIAGKQSAVMLAALAAKLGLASGAKGAGLASGAGLGAATGAALCTGSVIGAPLAPACALVGGAGAGLAAWLALDSAILQTDEWVNREAFEAELHAALKAREAALIETLQKRGEHALEQAFDALQSGLDPPLNRQPPIPRTVGASTE